MYKSFPNPSEAKSRGIAIISKILSIHLSRVLLNYFNIGAFKLRTTNNKRANLAASRSFRELSTRKLTGTKTRMERSFSPRSSSIRSRVSKKENASIANLNIVSQIFVPSRRNDFSFSILEFVHRFFAIFITVESNNFPPPLFLSPKPLLARNNVSIRSRSAYLHRIRSKFNRVHLESFRNAAAAFVANKAVLSVVSIDPSVLSPQLFIRIGQIRSWIIYAESRCKGFALVPSISFRLFARRIRAKRERVSFFGKRRIPSLFLISLKRNRKTKTAVDGRTSKDTRSTFPNGEQERKISTGGKRCAITREKSTSLPQKSGLLIRDGGPPPRFFFSLSLLPLLYSFILVRHREESRLSLFFFHFIFHHPSRPRVGPRPTPISIARPPRIMMTHLLPRSARSVSIYG